MADFDLFPSILPDDKEAVDEVADDVHLADAEAALDEGACPFCDAYDGDHPANHAPKAHPNRWEALKNARAADTAATADAHTAEDSALTDGGEQ